MISYLCNIQPSKEIEKDVFSVFLQAWDKEKNLSTHEELNLRLSDSVKK